MAQHTTNYNLVKPESDDQFRLEHMNGNMNIIDQELKNLEDNKETPAGAQAKADAAESAAKSYTDTHENKTSTHGMTATPTASRGAMYDSGKRLSSGAAPTNNNHVIRKIDIDNVETVNFTHGKAYVIRNFVHLYINGGQGVEGELVTILPSSVRPISSILGVAFIGGPGVPLGSTSKLFSINTDGSVYCYNKLTGEDVYISAFYIKG